jgi:predicted GNAT superfamily acetyltransferase
LKFQSARLDLKSNLKILETPDEMAEVEALQAIVWPGAEREIVPVHLLLTAAHNGGLVIGAYEAGPLAGMFQLVGFVFGFTGLYFTPDGPRAKHCSHMLGVHPDFRGRGLGFALKRAQWQLVRHQGIDRITWTYDPLLSLNARLNISQLGAVCNTYLRNAYGEMHDQLNAGLASDRFQVDWWVNTQRVNRRLSRSARPPLDLAHYLAAGVEVINPTAISPTGWPEPAPLDASDLPGAPDGDPEALKPLVLVEIPADFQSLKAAEPALAVDWRSHSRLLFEDLFMKGYLVTDFIYLPGSTPRSFYVLSHGESTL